VIRTSAQYRDPIRDGREVYINGERVLDMPSHPMVRPIVDIRARIYDMAADHEIAAALAYPDPVTGEITPVAIMRDDDLIRDANAVKSALASPTGRMPSRRRTRTRSKSGCATSLPSRTSRRPCASGSQRDLCNEVGASDPAFGPGGLASWNVYGAGTLMTRAGEEHRLLRSAAGAPVRPMRAKGCHGICTAAHRRKS